MTAPDRRANKSLAQRGRCTGDAIPIAVLWTKNAASINDGDLHYEEHGAGIPIVFCHEFAQNLEGWSGQVPHFSRRYRTIAYSRRGYPPSAIPEREEAYSFAQSVADLEQLVYDVSASPAHIVGHGAGGNIALALVGERRGSKSW